MELYTGRVHDNDDPEQLGRLMIEVPSLLGPDGVWPDWIPPRVGSSAGDAPGVGGTALLWIPPVDSIVVIEAELGPASPRLRWSGGAYGSRGSIPPFLRGNYPARAGWSAPKGRSVIALDDDSGLFVVVDDATLPDGPKSYVTLGRDGSFQVGTSAGSVLRLDAQGAALLPSSGHLLQLDGDNDQIVICHRAGVELITLENGVLKVNGTAVQVTGGTIELGDGAGVPLDPFLLSLQLLADLSNVLAEVVAIGAGIPGGVPVPTPSSTAMIASIAASLGVGAPYLSTVITGK